MEAELKRLIELQKCDTRIKMIEGKKIEGPIRIQSLKDRLDEEEKELDKETKELESSNMTRRQTEQEIEALEEKVEKSNLKLDQVKSNKEYRAALKEIDDIKREKARLEDKAIELMENTEELESKLAEGQVRLEKLKADFEADCKEIENEMIHLEKELETLEMDRQSICHEVDTNLLRRYDTLMAHKNGLAISPVVDGVCQTCHLGIPPQRFNELIRGDELMSCPNCARIIYWAGDKRFQEFVEEVEDASISMKGAK